MALAVATGVEAKSLRTSPASGASGKVVHGQRASDGRQTHAGKSSAERTTDPYINLELMQNFKISIGAST